jgi:Asp/Glu/hydantoin racemase
MKLGVIQPVPFSEIDKPTEGVFRENFKTMAREGTDVDVLWLKTGYSEPTYTWTEIYNAVEIGKTCYRAWKAGYEGVVIGCTQDPGLIEARSIVDIPVTGVTESSVAFASTLGSKFSFVCLLPAEAASIADKIRRYGLADRLASIRYTELSSAEAKELYADPAKLVGAFMDVATKAIREDKPEVIIAGCTILSSILTHQGIHKIGGLPLIDPVWAGIKMAEVLVDLNKAYGIGICRSSIYAAAPDWEKEIPIEL